MSSDLITSSQIDNNNNASSSNDGNHNIADVLLYAESKITRKQAVREIGDVVLRANMKPRTVKHALQLLKALLPPENTLPSTTDELFGAMMSSENDWRLAQYLIKHKQQPSFSSSSPSSSSNILWSDNSNSNTSIAAASSSSIPQNQPSLFLPISSSSSSSSSSGSSDSESSSSSSSSSSSDDDDDDDDESNILLALREVQQQTLINSSPLRPIPEITENNLNHVISSPVTNESSDQRSQIVSTSLNRIPFLGSFKRQLSESSSVASSDEPDIFYTTRISNDEDSDDDDDDDDETPFYRNSNNINNKLRCFEMNGCDLLDGGKRRRH